jgi:penicillin-binding protein 2
VAYIPDPKRPIVVAVTVEEGGFGAATAAPIACRVMAHFYGLKDIPCAPGEDSTR